MPSAANGWAGQPPPTWQQGYGPQGTAQPAPVPSPAWPFQLLLSASLPCMVFISLIAGLGFHPLQSFPEVFSLLFPKNLFSWQKAVPGVWHVVPGVFHLFPLELPLPTWNSCGFGKAPGWDSSYGVGSAQNLSDKFG